MVVSSSSPSRNTRTDRAVTTADDRRPASARGARVVGIAGGAWIALHALGLLGPLADATFIVLAIVAVASQVVGIRWWKPAPRWPWVAMTTAMVLFLGGGIARTQLQTVGDLSESRSLLPELLTMPGYLFLAAGLVGLTRARSRRARHELDALLDAGLAALAAMTLAWVYLINPAMAVQHVPLHVRLLLACYPPLSVFLVAVAVRMAFMQGADCPLSFRSVFAGLCCMLAGDVTYMLVDARLMELPTQFVDVPYALAYLSVAVAVLHPSARVPVASAPTEESYSQRGRLTLVAVALCVPAVLIVTRPQIGDGDRVALVAIVLALTSTAAFRMSLSLRAHAQSQERLTHQATHDPLTGLPNRMLMHRHLDRLLAGQDDRPVGLLFLDIDRFKLINDTLGHGTGDELLIATAHRLQANLRPTDMVGRIGGDEFVVMVSDARDAAHVLEVAERIRLGFRSPFRFDAREIPITASIGVALQVASERGATAETLFRDADTAMYQAKNDGGDKVELFDVAVRERLTERVELEQDLRHALERDELAVHYQPVVQVHDGRVLGMEALLRWTHPTRGNVRPDIFIPVAEDSGLIVEIGAWVIDQACAQIAELRRTMPHGEALTVSVNLSARQLRDSSLLGHVAVAMFRHDLPASALCLELTESMLMEDVDRIAALLEQLRELGVRLSIDDFGTGYSSLAYLKRLPIDEVKIDRSFIIDIASNGADTSLVAAVVAIATSLGISTVAEGIEEQEQADLVYELGCLKAQGFMYSRPVPSADLPATIERLGLAGEATLRVVTA
jgi:diguanylate cyclase (GGDEF)-like protein